MNGNKFTCCGNSIFFTWEKWADWTASKKTSVKQRLSGFEPLGVNRIATRYAAACCPANEPTL